MLSDNTMYVLLSMGREVSIVVRQHHVCAGMGREVSAVVRQHHVCAVKYG